MKQPNNLPNGISPLFGSVFLRKLKQRLGKFIISHLPITHHVFSHIRWEMRALWVRINNRLNPFYIYRRHKIIRGDGLSVNIACGGSAEKGWVNLDLMRHNNLTLRYDCRKDLPLRDNSAARIRCEHFFEHLDFSEEAPFFLKSCYRSLKKGGVLRIIVPDAGRFLRAYQSGEKGDWLALNWDLDNLPEGFYTRMNIINHIFRQDGEHMYAYDFETLYLSLQRAGFTKIQKVAFGVSADPQLRQDSASNRPQSLYVEATR